MGKNLKQKQIEEMAKELCPHYNNGNCYYEFTEVCECCFGCEFCWAISQVLNAGYRKVCEPAIKNGEVVGFVNGADYVPKNLFLFGISNARKKTAEKFAERLKAIATKEIAHTIFDEFVYYRILEDNLDEIAKEIIGEEK
jgi:hypothetical protein